MDTKNKNYEENINEYHGIIINISQKDKSIFNNLQIIGKKKVLLGLVILYKIRVSENRINEVIQTVQNNMASKLLIKKQGYYAHFYRGNELIVVFKDKVFTVSTDKTTWSDAIEYGKHLKINGKQLDFIPNRFEDEDY